MKPVVRRFSIVVYFLVFQLLGLPLPLLAKTKAAPTAAEEGASQKIAVVELYDGKTKIEAVEKVADTLRDEMAHQPGFSVQSKEMTYHFFETSPNLLGAGAETSLNRYLDQAKEFYKTFNFKEAIALLEGTIEGYRGARSALTDPFLLTDAYLMLGNIHLGNNDPRRAQEAFQEAVRLDPERHVTERQYPPKTVSLFEKSREDYLKRAKSSSLEVQTSPSKADVYLNGSLKGQTPLKIERWSTGEHFLIVKAPGYRVHAQKLNLKSDSVEPKIVLEKISDPTVNRHGLTVTNLSDIDEQVRLGGAMGKTLGLDKVVLVSVEEIGWNNKISARMIDIRYQASHKNKSVEVLDLPKDTRSATNVIAKDLGEAARLDLAKDPKRYADSDVIVIGTKKKKSVWKSPWLWGLLGVAVAGG
ncbi:MAG: PEGA domain-containing protein, partial [Deltaproteobacteria bacterium]|nr:PEGA domain-containing protein [Deltaproteobacteria bacterium]